MFALSGLLMGSWASRIPALRDGLQISHSMLSFVLLCGGLGAVISYPLASRLMANFGGRRTTLYAGLGLSAVLPAIGLAPSVPLLMLAVLMLGVSGGCFGVGLNAVAARFEKAAGMSKMSRLHALGCVGSLGGALLGSFVAGMGIKPSMHFIAVALPVALLMWLSCQMLEADEGGEVIEKKAFALPSGPLAVLGILGFCGAMSENSIADWSGVYLKDHFNVSAGVAPLALSAFTVMMLVSRLMGDRLKEKHGARRLVSSGAVIAASGLFLAVFAPSAPLALAGFAFAGMGLSLLFPFIYSAAGREGPMATASVATVCNIGGLMGPPVIGTMADHLGIQVAIGFIGLLSVAIAFVSARANMLK
ncbi:MFS transporter [Noviherbaspirillum massiliense]|uniref:MFS transporter n=1 Tax=Noviherbaspirillum massiliense TaxID=1465823 RepID=UPI0002DF5E16|nr:MFS transporter [Noviherbaspirillum massiliense]